MKKSLIIAGAALLLPFSAFAATDYYLEIEGVKGESAKAGVSAETSVSRSGDIETEVEVKVEHGVESTSTSKQLGKPKYEDIKAQDDDQDDSEKKGNVEFEWKVEEGESITGDPDFDLLFFGGADSTDEDLAEGLERAMEVITENAKASDQAIESVSLNFEKIQTKVKQEFKFFGFIPLIATAEVEIDAEGEVKVKFPWWAFLTGGADRDALGERVYNTISNVLKTKHDTLKNSIGNIR